MIVTHQLSSYVPAVKRVLPTTEHRRHKRLDNRAENSHLPVRKHERVLLPALGQGVLEATEGSGRLAASLLGARHTSLPETTVGAYLDELAVYVDDERWRVSARRLACG